MTTKNIINSDINKFFDWMKRASDTGQMDGMPVMHSSSLHYIRNLLNSKFNSELSLQEVNGLLYEEGLLSSKEYKIPQWYINKYGD